MRSSQGMLVVCVWASMLSVRCEGIARPTAWYTLLVMSGVPFAMVCWYLGCACIGYDVPTYSDTIMSTARLDSSSSTWAVKFLHGIASSSSTTVQSAYLG